MRILDVRVGSLIASRTEPAHGNSLTLIFVDAPACARPVMPRETGVSIASTGCRSVAPE
jgi:hypothetical protein